MAGDLGVGFVDVLPRSDKFVSTLTTQMSRLSSVATAAGKGVGNAIQLGIVGAGALAVVGITKGIQATQDWAAEVRTLQRVTGESAEQTSALAAAGNLLNLSTTKLNTGFGLLGKNIVNNSANLIKYGVATHDAQGNVLPFSDVLANLSDKFQTLPKGPEQAAFAMNVFGRSGKELIPILARGSAGLQELYDKAEAAGLIMDQETLDASKNLSIAQRGLGEAVKGASIQLGEAFIPVAQKATDVLTSFVEISQKIPQPVTASVAAIAALAAIAIVAQKAFILMRGAAAAAMTALSGWALPITVLVGSLVVLRNVVAAAHIDLQKMAGETKINADLLGYFRDRMDLVGHVFESHSLAGFIAGLGDTYQHLKDLTAALEPAVTQMQNLGISEDAQTDILGRYAGMLDGSAEAQDKYIARTQGVIDIVTDEAALYAKGTISLQDYTGIVATYGLTTQDAFQVASGALDQYGFRLDKNGQKVRNWAGMTKAAMSDFKKSFNDAIDSTFGTLGATIADTFDLTTTELVKQFDQQRLAAERYHDDIKRILHMTPEDLGVNAQAFEKFKSWLLQQAPDVIDAYSRGTRAQQLEMLHDWQKWGSEVSATKAVVRVEVDTSSAKLALVAFLSALDAAGAVQLPSGGWTIPITSGGRHFTPDTGGNAAGAIIPGASGFITRGPTYLVGEGGYATPAGRGGEAVIPLNQRGAAFMRRAWGNSGGHVSGDLRIRDWRNGIATLEAEMGWNDAVRGR